MTDRGEFGGSRTISRHRKRNRTTKNSVIVRPLKVNWAVCINLINNVSKVITNNQCINSLSKVWTLIPFVWLRSGTVYALCNSRRKENDCAKKEANIKKRISFKESMTKLSDKQKSLSYLDYFRTVQSFYSSDRDLYSRTLVFFFLSVGSNLYARKYISRELTQIKMLWLPAQWYWSVSHRQ